MGVPTETVRFQSSKLRYALSGRLYFCSFAGLFCIFRKVLLHRFVALELLQKIVMAPRDGMLHRLLHRHHAVAVRLLFERPGAQQTPRVASFAFGPMFGIKHSSRENPCFQEYFPLGLSAAGRMIVLSFMVKRLPVSPRGYCRE